MLAQSFTKTECEKVLYMKLGGSSGGGVIPPISRSPTVGPNEDQHDDGMSAPSSVGASSLTPPSTPGGLGGDSNPSADAGAVYL